MRRTLLGVLLVVSVGGAVATEARIPRVRALSERTARLIDVGRALSPTIRAMLDRIDASDLILQVDTRLDLGVPNAVTRLVTATADFRYVRVSINPRLAPQRRLELLAHELQHVLEIAADTTVRDQDGMRDYFTRIGRRQAVTGTFETDAAMDVESVVRREVGQAKSRDLATLDR